MKKKISRVRYWALAAVVAILLLILTACGGGMSGTYVTTNPIGGASFGEGAFIYSIDFKKSGDAEIETLGWTGSIVYQDSSYKIKDDSITLKAEWNYTDEIERSYSFSQDGDSIFIDGLEYVKS